MKLSQLTEIIIGDIFEKNLHILEGFALISGCF